MWVLRVPFSLVRWTLHRLRHMIRRRPIVLELSLEGSHPARSRPTGLLRRGRRSISRLEIRERLRAAAEDPLVSTVRIRLGPLSQGWGALHELRELISRVRKAGKRTIAFVAHPDMRTMWIASAADEVLIPPHVPVDMAGMAIELTFMGEGLGKLGLDFDVVAAGRFKSAMEPLTRTAPTAENERAIDAMLSSLYDGVVEGLAARPGCTPDSVRAALDRGPHLHEDAVELKLADGIIEEEEVAERLDCHPKGRARALSLTRYRGRVKPLPSFGRGRPRLGLVELRGNIVEGRDEERGSARPGTATVRALVDALDEAKEDRRIKGVLLRIDSRGGSAVASERMWRAVRAVRKKKPVVAYLGNYAASGGYYVACAADRIVAAPGTLTGSIGVIAAKPVGARLLAHLGIHQVRFERGDRAGMNSFSRGFTEAESQAIEASVEQFYKLFIRRVAEGRQRDADTVEPVAQGRIWTGCQALDHGLVDDLGDEQSAIDALADLAGLRRRPALWALGRGPGWLERLGLPLGAAINAGPAWLSLLELTRHERVLAFCPVDAE